MQKTFQNALHSLWQLLPHPFRNGVFDRASLIAGRFSATAATTPPPLQEPYIVAGSFHAPTGLGEAARLTVQALRTAGYAVATFDTTNALRQENTVSFTLGETASAGAGTLIVFANPPSSSFVLWLMGKRLLKGKYFIANFVWEYPRTPATWGKHAARFNAIVAPSTFAAKILSEGLQEQGLKKDVSVMPIPVAEGMPDKASLQRPSDQNFNIFFVGDAKVASARKNPIAVLDAVHLAFGSDENVFIKLLLRGAADNHEVAQSLNKKAQQFGLNLTIDTALLDRELHLERYTNADVFISLHRSEGFGIALAEAMLMGIPVASTDYSATTEYISEETGFPIAATQVDAPPLINMQKPGSWAEPDINAAAEALKFIRKNPEIAQFRAQTARRVVRENYDTSNLIRSLNSLKTFPQ